MRACVCVCALHTTLTGVQSCWGTSRYCLSDDYLTIFFNIRVKGTMLNPRTAPEVGTMVPFRAVLLGRPFCGDRRPLCCPAGATGYVFVEHLNVACETQELVSVWHTWLMAAPCISQRRLRTVHSRRPWHSKGSTFGIECQPRDWPGISSPHQDIVMTWKSANGRAQINLSLVHTAGWVADTASWL